MASDQRSWSYEDSGESYPLAHHIPQNYNIDTSYTGYDASARYVPTRYESVRSPVRTVQISPPPIIRKPTQGYSRSDSFSRRAHRRRYSNISDNDKEDVEASDYSFSAPVSPPPTIRSRAHIQNSNHVPNDTFSIQRSLPSIMEPHSDSGNFAPKQAQEHVTYIGSSDVEDVVGEKADQVLTSIVRVLRLKEAFHWWKPKSFHPRAIYQWQAPMSYQASMKSGALRRGLFKHLDVFHRKFEGLYDEQWLDPLDGRVRRLIVQTTNSIYDSENDTTWRRTYIRNVSPMMIRLAWFPYAGLPYETTTISESDGLKDKVIPKRMVWTSQQWTQLCMKWVPACVGLLVLMVFPTDVEGQVRNHGFYDPVPYRFWSYPKSARNYFENLDAKGTAPTHTKDHRLSSGRVGPRFLCFLDEISPDNPRGRLEPEAWLKKHPEKTYPNYIFISYTRKNQFEDYCDDGKAEIAKTGKATCPCSHCQNTVSDADALHRIAYIAAQHAEVPAYWTDKGCMSEASKEELSEDIYRIADVMRAAQKMVIIVGRSGMDTLTAPVSTFELLKEWSDRMWTWPEILLSPSGQPLTIYTRDTNSTIPIEISKLNLAEQILSDTKTARQLFDHYENTLTLSRLELVVLALDTLKSRKTSQHSEGDLSYALMGLLRQRPLVDITDTAFQAFARLSLVNDSDRLLERVICLLPPADEPLEPKQRADHRRHYWANMSDRWGAKLWDIEPYCQVAGIAENDTVIIDGAFGATIHWDSFQRVAITTRETWSRMLGRILVRGTPGWFLMGIFLVAIGQTDPTATAFGAILLIISLVLILLSPILILHIYSGKVWNSQPWLFGFEGHMQLRDIERKIFGFPCGRLAWAPYSSHLSKHRIKSDFLLDECEGIDPLDNSGGFRKEDSMRLFTVVDTMTMSVSLFHAERPPVIALLAGSEGGMQRALMCSYDWTTQTLYRESVLRMETRMLERMPRIGRVRFGLRRWQDLVTHYAGEV